MDYTNLQIIKPLCKAVALLGRRRMDAGTYSRAAAEVELAEARMLEVVESGGNLDDLSEGVKHQYAEAMKLLEAMRPSDDNQE